MKVDKRNDQYKAAKTLVFKNHSISVCCLAAVTIGCNALVGGIPQLGKGKVYDFLQSQKNKGKKEENLLKWMVQKSKMSSDVITTFA